MPRIKKTDKEKTARKKPLLPAKKKKFDWKPFIAGGIVFMLIISSFIFVINSLGPQTPPSVSGQPVDKYGPFDVYKAAEYDYYIRLNENVEWHFRVNPQDTVMVPIFPYPEDVKKALNSSKEAWMTYSPNERSRLIIAVTEIAKTAGALGLRVNQGYIRQPEKCKENATLDICSMPIIPMDFANENRTVFRFLGPEDANGTTAQVFVMGHNIIIQGGDYDQLELAADKVCLLMLNLA